MPGIERNGALEGFGGFGSLSPRSQGKAQMIPAIGMAGLAGDGEPRIAFCRNGIA